MKPLSFRNRPIAAKLRLIIIVACVVVTALTCGAFVAYQWGASRSSMVRALTTRAQILAFNSAAAVAFNQPEDAAEILRAVQADPPTVGVAIFDKDGHLFTRYTTGIPESEIEARSVSSPHYAYSGGFVTVWVPIEAKKVRLGTLAIKRGLYEFYQQLRLYLAIAAGVMAASTLVAYWISSRLQRVVSDPILSLTGIARRVTEQKDYAIQAPRTSEDEIGVLTDAFNIMLLAIHNSQEETSRLYRQVREHAADLENRVAERTGQLLNANQELEAFGSSVSHDLRGPLRHIMGFSQILIEDYGPQIPKAARDYLDKIFERSAQMERLIDALLEFSRVSKQSLAVQTIDMARLCRKIVAELRPDDENHRIEVKIGDLPPCKGDLILIQQVLVNLIGNALKYSRNSNPALIEISASVPAGGTAPVYSIKDNGVGFDMVDADKLFVVFERLHDARDFEGTGVGLATAQRIIQRHGGRIWAESAPGAGATFSFTLGDPLASSGTHAPPSEAIPTT